MRAPGASAPRRPHVPRHRQYLKLITRPEAVANKTRASLMMNGTDVDCTPSQSPPPLLLREQEYRASRETASRDFQVRFAERAALRWESHTLDGNPWPAVVVATRAADREMDHLSLAFAAEGVRLVRLDSDLILNTDVVYDPVNGPLWLGEFSYAPRVFWTRHWEPQSITGALGPTLDLFSRDQWTSFVEALATDRRICQVNSLASARSHGRLAQLARARSLGMPVPATIVATNPVRARQHLRPRSGRVIVKTLGAHFIEHRPGMVTGLFPKIYSVDELDLANSAEVAPTMYQDWIEALHELRVFYVYGDCITYEVERVSPESMFISPESLQVCATLTPPRVASFVTSYMRDMQLNLVAFDFLVTPEGPVFLEVNIPCDWRYFEVMASDDRVTTVIMAVLRKEVTP